MKDNSIKINCIVLLGFILMSACNFSSTVASEENLFIDLFDGHSFDGWNGDTTQFRIEEEAIIAGNLQTEIPHNFFLCTNESYTNFELQIKAKFVAKNNNGGIQFRSKRIPNNHEVIGYQCDVGYDQGKPLWGSLYDESRRNRFLIRIDEQKIDAVLNPDDWNHFRIVCQGNQVEIWMNATLMLNYEETDPEVDNNGVICVQIHGGPPSEARYKDIKIKKL